MPAKPFDVGALLAAHQHDALDLQERYINPPFAQVLRTIGFDANYVRGEGAYLWDDRGRRYIDCLGGYAVFNVGRNHPVVRAAIAQAMALDLPNLPGVGAFRVSGLLAQELVAIAPAGLEMVYFCNSGTEGIEAAIKFARAATGRGRVVYCHRSYHGLTIGSLSINGNHEFRDGFGPLLADVTEIPFNDLPALKRELDRGDVAAFVVEPIQGKGVNIPADGYLAAAADMCRRAGGVIVFDEVQTGFGRTGRMFGCEHWGVAPDIMVIAKGLSGGYIPVGAVLSRRWIHERVFSTMGRCSVHQCTFGQNDLAMVAGLATLHVMREERTAEHAAAVGGHLVRRLRETLLKYEMVKDIRGKGLMVAIEFGPPRSAALKMGWNLLHKMDESLFCQAILMPLMTEHRILAQVAGHRLDVIKLIPPLTLTREDVEQIVHAFDATVGACHRFPGPVWEVGAKLGAAAMKRFAGGARPEPAMAPA